MALLLRKGLAFVICYFLERKPQVLQLVSAPIPGVKNQQQNTIVTAVFPCYEDQPDTGSRARVGGKYY